MENQYCKHCGSELNDDGSCPNMECESNQNRAKEEKEKTTIKKPFFNANTSIPVKFDVANLIDTAKRLTLGTVKKYIKEAESEKGKLIVPECVDPDDNEVAIKQYDIARLRSLLSGSVAEGRLEVTNKRVIFRANGISFSGPIRMQTEYSIEEVGGIDVRKEVKFNIIAVLMMLLVGFLTYRGMNQTIMRAYNRGTLGMFFCIIMIILAAVLLFVIRRKSFIRFFLINIIMNTMPLNSIFLIYNDQYTTVVTITAIIFGISILLCAFNCNLKFRVLSKGGNASIEVRAKEGIFARKNNAEYTGFHDVLPGSDTDTAIKELGALIRSVQHGQIK